MERIDPTLLSPSKKADYQSLLRSSVAMSERYSRIMASRTTRSVTMETQGKKSKLHYTEERVSHERSESDAIAVVTGELTELLDGFHGNRLSLAECLAEYRLRVPQSHWPTVMIGVFEGSLLESVHAELEKLGYPLADNEYDEREPRQRKLDIFDLLHLRVPPDPALIAPLVDVPGVAVVFDGDGVVNLPDPISADDVGVELAESVPIIWPPHQRVPAGLPPPGKGVKLCVIDSGVDDTHPDLKGRVAPCRDFTGEGSTADANGHGTHCAGIAGGTGRASGGRMRGVAPHVTIMSARVFDRWGRGRTSDILTAMRWAYDEGAEVVSMSMGASGARTDGQSLLSRACSALADRGIIVCVSAGNDGPGTGTITVPADSRGAIAVGAIDKRLSVAGFSSRGPTNAPEQTGTKPDAVAPGVAILGARARNSGLPPAPNNPSYSLLSGTSMACPHVAGAAAVMLSYAKSLGLHAEVGRVRDALIDACGPLRGYQGNAQGKGLINIPRALLRLEGPPNYPAGGDSITRRSGRMGDSVDDQTAKAGMGTESELTQGGDGGGASELGYCSACGKKISTRIDTGGRCETTDCGAPVCNHCWTAERIRRCRRHRGC